MSSRISNIKEIERSIFLFLFSVIKPKWWKSWEELIRISNVFFLIFFCPIQFPIIRTLSYSLMDWWHRYFLSFISRSLFSFPYLCPYVSVINNRNSGMRQLIHYNCHWVMHFCLLSSYFSKESQYFDEDL